MWFLATAFSNFMAAVIAQFTGVGHGEGEGRSFIPPPTETVHIYGAVFGNIAIAGLVCAGVCFALVPLLKRWTHPDAPYGDPDGRSTRRSD
jgi:POT family proton-dependent oligopeptide transporter